jgi:hypothetical protein
MTVGHLIFSVMAIILFIISVYVLRVVNFPVGRRRITLTLAIGFALFIAVGVSDGGWLESVAFGLGIFGFVTILSTLQWMNRQTQQTELRQYLARDPGAEQRLRDHWLFGPIIRHILK